MTILLMPILLAKVYVGAGVVVWKKITPRSQVIVDEVQATLKEKNKNDVKLPIAPIKFPLILRLREYVAYMLKIVKERFSLTITEAIKLNTVQRNFFHVRILSTKETFASFVKTKQKPTSK